MPGLYPDGRTACGIGGGGTRQAVWGHLLQHWRPLPLLLLLLLLKMRHASHSRRSQLLRHAQLRLLQLLPWSTCKSKTALPTLCACLEC